MIQNLCILECLHIIHYTNAEYKKGTKYYQI